MPVENEATETEVEEVETEETPTTEEGTTEAETSEATEEEPTSESDVDEDEEEFDVTQYIDLKNVPPQFKEAATRMLSGLQKAHTQLRKDAKQAIGKYQDQLATEFAEDVQLAQGFRQLIQTPGFREFYTDLQDRKPYGYSSVYNKGDVSKSNEGDEDDSSASSEKGNLSMDKILARVEQHIGKVIDARLGPIAKNQARNALADAEKNLPNFNKYRPQVVKLMSQHPTLSVEDAYNLASEKDRTDLAIANALKKAKETSKVLAKHRTTKPSAGGGTSTTTVPKSVKDIREAVTLATRQISKG